MHILRAYFLDGDMTDSNDNSINYYFDGIKLARFLAYWSLGTFSFHRRIRSTICLMLPFKSFERSRTG